MHFEGYDARRRAVKHIIHRFRQQCPVLHATTCFSASLEMEGQRGWHPLISFSGTEALELHLDDHSWWLSSWSGRQQGTALMELADADPNFERKVTAALKGGAI